MKKKGIVIFILALSIIGYKGIKENNKKKSVEIIEISKELDAREEKSGLILVNKAGHFGYIDKENKEVFKPEWEDIEFFDALDYVRTKKENTVKIFSKNGKEILSKNKVLDIIPVEKNLFLVKSENKKLRLENEKQEIISKEYDYMNYIGDNQYTVANFNEEKQLKVGMIEIIADKEKNILDLEYEGITKINKEDFILIFKDKFEVVKDVYSKEPLKIEIDGRIAYYDSERLISKYKDSDKLHFFKARKKVSYDYIGTFLHNLAVIKSQDKYGVIDKEGKLILIPKYEFLNIASKDLLIFKEKDKYGYINLKQEVVIDPIYDEVTAFYGNRAMAILDDKILVIDKNGNIIKKAIYDIVTEIKDDVIIGGKSEGFGAVNSKGKEIILPKYDDVEFWGTKYIKAILNNNIYIFDYEGNILLKLPVDKESKFYRNQINVENKIYLFKK